MLILQQSALFSSTLLPAVLLLAAPPQRLALPAPRMPKIAGLLPSPKSTAGGDIEPPLRISPSVSIAPVNPAKPAKRIVTAEIIEQPRIDINIYKDPKGWWDEFERIFGRIKSIEEMDAELEAKHPGYLAWIARMDAQALAEAASS